MSVKRIAPSLLFALACAVSMRAQTGPFEVLPLTRDNPYGVSTEKNFPSAFRTTIWPWFLQSEQGVFAGQREVPIHYRIFARPDRLSEKGAIVISSGRTEGLIIYPELIHDLWKQGYSVYIHDHRGQGFSGGRINQQNRGDVKSFDDFVADLARFVDTVVKPRQHRRVFLLAHSMGGGIGSLFLEQHPGTFDGAVLVSPMHEPLLPLAGRDLTRTICGVAAIAQGFWSPSEYAIQQGDYVRLRYDQQTDLTHSEVRWAHTREMYDAYPKARVGGPTHRWIREACDAGERARERAGGIDIPILIIQAGADEVVRNEAQVEFCRNAPRCTGAVVPRARHALFIERDDFRLPMLNRTIAFFDAESLR
jgi:lysophospholipase